MCKTHSYVRCNDCFPFSFFTCVCDNLQINTTTKKRKRKKPAYAHTARMYDPFSCKPAARQPFILWEIMIQNKKLAIQSTFSNNKMRKPTRYNTIKMKCILVSNSDIHSPMSNCASSHL